jgi:hypothetical protein
VAAIDQQHLLESARDFAELALNAYVEDDTRVILAKAAFSLEHLCKAYLYGMHPALLMELRNGQLDSLLYLVGHGGCPFTGCRDLESADGGERW